MKTLKMRAPLHDQLSTEEIRYFVEKNRCHYKCIQAYFQRLRTRDEIGGNTILIILDKEEDKKQSNAKKTPICTKNTGSATNSSMKKLERDEFKQCKLDVDEKLNEFNSLLETVSSSI
jgi:pantothenate kinase-related protein Tda10